MSGKSLESGICSFLFLLGSIASSQKLNQKNNNYAFGKASLP